MALTAAEQYLIELINRSRLDPAAEAKRFGVSLNQGLGNGTIDTKAKEVLAPNSDLAKAATSHSGWMLNQDSFSHTGVGGSNAGIRMENAGYTFAGTYAWRENLAWTGSTSGVSLTRAIEEHHEGLYLSAGHRSNTFATGIREIGVGQVEGKFSYQGTNFDASMLTEKFALSGSSVFVTGVAYKDNDKDNFYSIGEGKSGYWFKGGGDNDKTASAGGYALDVGNKDDVTVTVGNGGKTLAKLDIDTSDGNAKLDLVIEKNGDKVLYLSGSADLESGIADATLLGVANLDLTGSAKANVLTGNDGNNTLSGQGSHDKLFGGQGRDKLNGDAGRDKLFGGQGTDKMSGGDNDDVLKGAKGNDRLYGNEGKDKLAGGQDNDKIYGGDNGDRLIGAKGQDKLFGNEGSDKLAGGKGNDYLNGGKGRDIMVGGAGEDTFVFNGGPDKIADFENNVDTIIIDRALASSISDAMDYGRITGGDAVFDFGGGDVLTVRDVDDLALLANDLIIG